MIIIHTIPIEFTIFYDRIVAIDLETTGLDSKNDQIIEYSSVTYDLSGNQVAVKTILIKPTISLPEKIVEITGITDDDLKDAPSIEDVMDEIYLDITASNTVYLAHNASFDFAFLRDQVIKRVSPKSIPDIEVLCTKRFAQYLKRLRRINPDSCSLEYLMKYLNLPDYTHHRAENDAKMCYSLYKDLSQK